MKMQMKGGYDSDDESNISRLVGGRVQEESVQVGAASYNSVFVGMKAFVCLYLYDLYLRIHVFTPPKGVVFSY